MSTMKRRYIQPEIIIMKMSPEMPIVTSLISEPPAQIDRGDNIQANETLTGDVKKNDYELWGDCWNE